MTEHALREAFAEARKRAYESWRLAFDGPWSMFAMAYDEGYRDAAEESAQPLQDTPESALSDTSIFEEGEMRRLTWKEVAKRARADADLLQAYRGILSDLSRCEHGRHLGDVCSACAGPSTGNAILTPGMVIGHDISGRAIIVPAKAQFAKAEEWHAARSTPTEDHDA